MSVKFDPTHTKNTFEKNMSLIQKNRVRSTKDSLKNEKGRVTLNKKPGHFEGRVTLSEIKRLGYSE